jgi:hypothetical protein
MCTLLRLKTHTSYAAIAWRSSPRHSTESATPLTVRSTLLRFQAHPVRFGLVSRTVASEEGSTLRPDRTTLSQANGATRRSSITSLSVTGTAPRKWPPVRGTQERLDQTTSTKRSRAMSCSSKLMALDSHLGWNGSRPDSTAGSGLKPSRRRRRLPMPDGRRWVQMVGYSRNCEALLIIELGVVPIMATAET